MNTHELDELVPARVNPGDWHNLVLGHDRWGQPAGVNLFHGAHTWIIGPLKTITLQRLVLSALSRGHEVVWIDTLTEAVDVSPIHDWFREVAMTPSTAVSSLTWLLSEAKRRRELMARWRVSCWRDLPQSMRLTALTVVIDNLIDLARCGKSLEEAFATPRRSAKRGNAVAQFSASYYVKRVLREGKSTGIHVVLADDASAAFEVPPSMWAHTSTRVLAPRRTDASGDLTSELFPGAAAEIAEGMRDFSETRGVMLIGTRDRISAVRLSVSLSAEAPVILKEIGVQKRNDRPT